MKDILRRTSLVIAALLLCLGAVAFGEEQKHLYTWKDKDGVLHVADSLEKIPKEYRAKAEQIEGGAPGGNVGQEGRAPVSSGTNDQGGRDETSLKAEWQSRMLDARRRLQYAEEQYRSLEKRKNDLQAQWGSAGAALPSQQVLDEMKQLDANMADAKAEVGKARDMIDNVIPDEARRAGVPPGWLREVE